MTREQHRGAAARVGGRLARPFAARITIHDPVSDESAEKAVAYTVIAAHHAREALRCPSCEGRRLRTHGFGGPQTPCESCLADGFGGCLATGLRTHEWLAVETVPLEIEKTESGWWRAFRLDIPEIGVVGSTPEKAKYWARFHARRIYDRCIQRGETPPAVMVPE